MYPEIPNPCLSGCLYLAPSVYVAIHDTQAGRHEACLLPLMACCLRKAHWCWHCRHTLAVCCDSQLLEKQHLRHLIDHWAITPSGMAATGCCHMALKVE
jgi:hypothetical protein